MDKQHLRDVVRDYCIQCGFAVVIDYASNIRYCARCLDVNCGWRLHASVLPDGITWAIKSIQNPEHTCQGLETKNSMVNVKWAMRVLLEDMRANNDIPAKSLNDKLWKRYGVTMAQSTLYRVRTKALVDIHSGHDVSYKGIAYAALDGLSAGRISLISVVGAHLKGNYGGLLLSAVALDGNNEIFPVAWAIVGAEDVESWKFFVWHLKNALQPSGKGDEWCIISNKQKGIDVAFNDLWPKVGRRYCCKHLVKNFKSSFPSLLMFQLFWKAAGAFNPFTFKKAMVALQKANPLALVWLSKLGPQSRWSKHAFNPAVKCDTNKSNFVESFNATMGIDRCILVLTLLEGIRRLTMVRMATRREACES
ncbi:uncharacterized protein LOC110716080 [Chenopodium quinoa]|uniref:uncharacterized protein LOC110716080 n=1 Tax=Chenopodium quinoa TaxID=63459 RepID=UPI000B776D46|nr:uncharacterized protein LOC110716080 [Chenopodium quinoa]